jgi:hypothetical protein
VTGGLERGWNSGDALLFGRWGVDVNNSSQQPTFVVDRLQDIIKIL